MTLDDSDTGDTCTATVSPAAHEVTGVSELAGVGVIATDAPLILTGAACTCTGSETVRVTLPAPLPQTTLAVNERSPVVFPQGTSEKAAASVPAASTTLSAAALEPPLECIDTASSPFTLQ